MAASRCFSGHTSAITCIEICDDRLVCTTSLLDQCIIQWRVEYEDQHWELDFNTYLQDKPDPFAEVPSQHKFEKLVHEIWNQRSERYLWGKVRVFGLLFPSS